MSVWKKVIFLFCNEVCCFCGCPLCYNQFHMFTSLDLFSTISSMQIVRWRTVLTLSIMCTDKQDLLSVKFHLNEFCQIFIADSLGLHCYSYFIVALLTVSAWQKCACVTACNVARLMTCMWSVCFLSDTPIKSVELCQVIVSHFVTLTEDSVAPGCKSSRIVVQRIEEKFCIMEESMVSVLCLCIQKNKTSSVNTRKRN